MSFQEISASCPLCDSSEVIPENGGDFSCEECGHVWGQGVNDDGFPCPECASKRTYQLDGALVEDVGNDDYRLGISHHCVDCGHNWDEWSNG